MGMDGPTSTCRKVFGAWPETYARRSVATRVPCDSQGFRFAAIGEVHQRAWVDEQALAAFLSSATSYLFISVVAVEVVGSLNGYSLLCPGKGQPQFLLSELDVKKEWRRRGFAAALVNAFVSEARASGAREVWVLTNDSNQAATAVYRQCGFTRQNVDDGTLTIAL